MTIKTYKPITPGLRHKKTLDKKELNMKHKVIKNLSFGFNKSGGRNNKGHICITGRGGGSKKLFRVINFKQKFLSSAIVLRIEYDPNRSANIALILYENMYVSYIIANEKLEEGSIIEFGPEASHNLGNVLPIKCIYPGTPINNIELYPNKGSSIARSAGTFGMFINHVNNYHSLILLKTMQYKKVLNYCQASIGVTSNKEYKHIKLGKAGSNRWLGRKPHVRGVAKNPVDHPHGGGEGRTSGGRKTLVNFTGKVKKGVPTRKKSKVKLLTKK
jgi:large subunit ribosomal protein L2